MTSEFPDHARIHYNYAAENTASSMTKGEIAEFTDFGVRSRCCGINVYLNGDVRKHALLTISQHNGVLMHFYANCV